MTPPPKLRMIPYVAQPRLVVYSHESGKPLGWYKPDILIEDKIITEFKVNPVPIKKFEWQLLKYLKTSEYEIAYLINFGIWPLYFKRFIHTTDRKSEHNSSSH